jgi:hypothetical protein
MEIISIKVLLMQFGIKDKSYRVTILLDVGKMHVEHLSIDLNTETQILIGAGK